MTWTIAPEPVDSGDAADALRAYLVDIVGRYHGRPATTAEVEQAIAEVSDDGLRPPDGQFLLARDASAERKEHGKHWEHGKHEEHGKRRASPGVIGCAGVRLLSPKIAELKRLWVRPDARGLGLGGGLVRAAEQTAAGLGATTMRLDTRSDLTEAQRLYARHGYAEIAPYHHDDDYAELFFEKRLD